MKRIIIIFLIITAGAGLSFAARDIHRTITFSSKGLSLINVTEFKGSDGTAAFRLGDTTYEHNSEPLITDMILSFNNPARNTDDTGRYKISKSSFELSSIDGATGGKAALLYRQNDGIELSARENLWLSSYDDLGSFSIEFRANTISIREGAVLFSRIGYASGIKNGIEIKISNGRAAAFMYGLFTDTNGERKTFALRRGPRLKEGTWIHYAVSFDRLSGKCAQFVNGKEEDVLFITETGAPNEGVMTPSFTRGDMPKTVIGSKYHGYLDEMKISYRNYEDLRKVTDSAERRFRNLRMSGRTPINREGIITSSVIELPGTGTMVNLFAWDEIAQPESFAFFEFRMSDIRFSTDDTRLKWYRISNNQRNIYMHKTPDGFLRGKYYQWRARLIPSPEGATAPAIKNIRMKYEIDTAPGTPMYVKAESVGDSIILSWKKNVDFDLAGYKIYYGVRSGRYDGLIRRINGRPLTNELSKTNTITVTIDNNVIEENRAIDSGGVLEYPVLKTRILYYFAVSAYDSYKIDSPYNHESSYSAETSARPYQGSEIR